MNHLKSYTVQLCLKNLSKLNCSARMATIHFTRADGGTVILEEINYLPIRLQSQLNSYLEEVGNLRMNDENVGVPDVRIIATSSERLDTWVDEGKFREDLYYRISVIPLMIPPLRKRQEDIELLTNYFLGRYAKISGENQKLSINLQ